jgi:hypothetical protein
MVREIDAIMGCRRFDGAIQVWRLSGKDDLTGNMPTKLLSYFTANKENTNQSKL